MQWKTAKQDFRIFEEGASLLPVPTTGIEIRAFGDTQETTEQGDKIPPVATTAKMIVGQEWKEFPVFFLPYNATDRRLVAVSSDNTVATIDARNQDLAEPYDYAAGTARKKNLTVDALKKGETTLTITPEHGEAKSLDLTVVTSSEIYGGGSSGAGGGSGTFFLNFSFPMDVTDLVGIEPNFTTNNASILSKSRPSNQSIRYVFQRNSAGTASASGYLQAKMKDGTWLQLCQTQSYTLSA